MLLKKVKFECVLKLFAREFVTAAEKRDDAKREQAALSSLLVCTRRENDGLTRCDKSRSLAVVMYHGSRLMINVWVPDAADGGEVVPNRLKGMGCSGEVDSRVMSSGRPTSAGVRPARPFDRRYCSRFDAAAHD